MTTSEPSPLPGVQLISIDVVPGVPKAPITASVAGSVEKEPCGE